MICRLTETSLLVGLFVLPFSKSGAEIATTLAIVLWTASGLLSCRRPHGGIDVWPYTLFLLAGAVSMAFTDPSLGLEKGFRGLLKWVQYLLLFFACRDLLREEGFRRRMVTTFLVSAAFLTLNGVWQMVSGVDLVKGYSIDIPGRFQRMRSSLGSPNGLAAFYLFALPLAFHRWIERKKWDALSAGLAALMLGFAYGFLATLSRAAFLGFVVSTFVFIVTRVKLRYVLIAGAIGAAALFSSEMMRENFVGSLSPRDITIGERVRFWDATARMVGQKPLLGHGLNTFYRVFPRYLPAEETYRGYAHNSYFQIAAENGLLGILFFLLPLAALFRKSGPDPTGLKPALGVAIGAFLIHAFFDNHFFALQTAVLFWIFWGMHVSFDAKKP